MLLKVNGPTLTDIGGGILVSTEGLTFRKQKTVKMGDTFLPTPAPPRSQSLLVAELGLRSNKPPNSHHVSFCTEALGQKVLE